MTQFPAAAKPAPAHARWKTTALAVLAVLCVAAGTASWYLWDQTQTLNQDVAALHDDLSLTERAVEDLTTATADQLPDETVVEAINDLYDRLDAVERDLGDTFELDSASSRIDDLGGRVATLEAGFDPDISIQT